MYNTYFTLNMRDMLGRSGAKYTESMSLTHLIADFYCPPNSEVEHFLRHNAVLFSQKHQSITHLVFRRGNVDAIMGYYTLAVKPISVNASLISKTMGRKMARVSVLNPENNTYTASAYLIAQLGKNFAVPREERISGKDLLALADITVKMAQHLVGGVVEFLECENNAFLLDFYEQSGFKPFDTRVTNPQYENEPHELVQLLRFI